MAELRSDLYLEEHGRLWPTVVQRTPSGGLHYLYLCSAPISNSAGQLGAGLDVRSRGGCIALAPSVRRDGAYRWARGFAPDEIDIEGQLISGGIARHILRLSER